MEKPSGFQERKFDTLSLLKGLSEADAAAEYSIDDILKEFKASEGDASDADLKENTEDISSDNGNQSIQKNAEKTPPEMPKVPVLEDFSEEDNIINQIRLAIEREMDYGGSVPAPVIHIDDISSPLKEISNQAENAYKENTSARKVSQTGSIHRDNKESMVNKSTGEVGDAVVQRKSGEKKNEPVAGKQEQKSVSGVQHKKPESTSGAKKASTPIKQGTGSKNPVKKASGTNQPPKENAGKKEKTETGDRTVVTEESIPAVREEPPLSEADLFLRKHGFRLVRKEEELPAESVTAEETVQEESSSVQDSPEEPKLMPVPVKNDKKKAVSKQQTVQHKKPAKKPVEQQPKEKTEVKNEVVSEPVKKDSPAETFVESAQVIRDQNPIRIAIQEVEGQPVKKNRKKNRKNSKLKLVREIKAPQLEELYLQTNKALTKTRTISTISTIFAVIAVIATVACTYGWTTLSILSNPGKTAKLLALLLALGIAFTESCRNGIRDLFQFRFTGEAVYVLSVFIQVFAALLCGTNGKLPPVAGMLVIHAFVAKNEELRWKGIRRGTKNALKDGIRLESLSIAEKAYEEKNTILVSKQNQDAHVKGLLDEDYAQFVRNKFGFTAVLVAVVLGIISALVTEIPAFWCISAFLVLGLPSVGWISYSRPYSVFAGNNMKRNNMISGWTGIRAIAKGDSVRIIDRDLFPVGKVSLGGVKLYNSIQMSLAAGYVSAIMNYAKSGLSPLFNSLKELYRAPDLYVSQFRFYEGGGYGAEITGDVILVGGRRFMQLMGIRMTEGMDIPNAIYMSVNGKLSAVFVLNYMVSKRIQKALSKLMHTTEYQLLFGTRDFMLNPLFAEKHFKLSIGRILYPGVDLRCKVSEWPESEVGTHAAMMEKTNLVSRAELILKTNSVYKTIVSSTVSGMLMNGTSVLMLFLLLILGKSPMITAFSVILMQFLFAVPTLILMGRIRRE